MQVGLSTKVFVLYKSEAQDVRSKLAKECGSGQRMDDTRVTSPHHHRHFVLLVIKALA